MLKEDLNGKLLQRAELVACKEEFEAIFENFSNKYPEESDFIIKDKDLLENIQGYLKREHALQT